VAPLFFLIDVSTCHSSQSACMILMSRRLSFGFDDKEVYITDREVGLSTVAIET